MLEQLALYGFPFDRPRPGQKKAILDITQGILQDDIPIHIVSAPTGSGKSAIAITLARSIREHWRSILDIDANRQTMKEFADQERFTISRAEPPFCREFSSIMMSQRSSIDKLKFILATPRKVLQDQYEKDFGSSADTTLLKGRSNYTCGYDPERRADDCGLQYANARTSCSQCGYCPYTKAVSRALGPIPNVVCNFHSLEVLLERRWNADGMPAYSFLVVDEAHLLPDYLKNRFSCDFALDEILADWEKLARKDEDTVETAQLQLSQLAQRLQGKTATPDSVIEGLRELGNICMDIVMTISMTSTGRQFSDEYFLYSHRYRVLDSFLLDARRAQQGLLKEFPWEFTVTKKEAEEDIFGDMTPEETRFHVVCKSPAPGFREMAKHFNAIVLMSGTLSPEPFRKELGIPQKVCQLHYVQATAPLSYRPLVYLGTKETNMKYANKDEALPLIGAAIAKLGRFHQSWRGIIHTFSGKNARALQQHIREALSNDRTEFSRYIFHFGGNKKFVMQKFMQDPDNTNTILVSPSLVEGFDGKGRIARWQCIIKVPYAPRNDPKVAARLREPDGDTWYVMETVNTLAQMYGRVCRADDDFGLTYVLDGGWSWFMRQLQEPGIWEHVPQVFREGVENCKKFYYLQQENGLSPVPVHESDKRVQPATAIRAADLLGRLK